MHLLLLVGRVLAFASGAHAVPFDRFDQQASRAALGLAGAEEGVVDLLGVMPAATQCPDLIVSPIFDQRSGFRVFAKEVFADVRAIFGFERLVITVDGFIHQLAQFAACVFLKQIIPAATPEEFDDVPSGAAEVALKFLHDLAVTAHWAVKALQVAVDDKDQIVEALALGEVNGAAAFRFVHFAVAKEAPDLAVAHVDQAAVVHVFHEPRLVDRHKRAEAHRDGRELPVIRHQPWVRIGGQAAAANFGTEVFKLFGADTAFHKGTGVDARDHVTLKEHQIATVDGGFRAPEVVEADVIKSSRRREGGNVAAIFAADFVPLDDSRHRVPAIDGANAPFHFGVTRDVDFVIR